MKSVENTENNVNKSGAGKTGIITFHFVNNFGGALQAYALRKYVSDRFCSDTGLVDYRHWFIRFTDAVRMLPITTNFRYYGPWFGAFPKILKRRRKFSAFAKRELQLSDRVNREGGLKKLGEDYQYLICGSDQIWNPTITMGLSKPYFLTFAPEGCRKFSYAASVGTVKPAKQKTMLGYLKDLDAVSIREKVDWIDDEPSLDVHHNIDPTFLLETEEWKFMARLPKKKQKYILTYFMQKNEDSYPTIQAIKNKKNCKVVEISRYGYKADCVDKVMVDVGPEEFVGLFSGASHICTNSFHGLAFGVIFNKSIDFIPIKRFSGRIEALCELLHLTKVPVDGGRYFHIEYDPEEVKTIIAREREKTYSYLEKAFKSE